MANFTDAYIRNLPLPEKGQKSYWDSSLAGFGIRLSQGGARTWMVLPPRSKVRTPETIGRYPVISLSEARTEAKRRLAEYTLGKRGSSIPYEKAVDEFLGEWEARLRPKTHGEYTRDLRRMKFGRLREVHVQEISRQLEKLPPAVKHHAFGTLRTFFGWAHGKQYVDENPIERMQSPQGSKPRERVLTDDELKKIWFACEGTHGDIVRLLILTGQRVGEITKLSRDMIADESITLPSWLTKNKREHHFPIGTTAQSILKPLCSSASQSGLSILFPARGRTESYFSGFSKCKVLLDARCGVSDWTLHDIRRTFASGLASEGVPLHVIEKCLNHVSGSFRGIVSVYQKYEFYDEMKVAVEKWDERIKAILAQSETPHIV